MTWMLIYTVGMLFIQNKWLMLGVALVATSLVYIYQFIYKKRLGIALKDNLFLTVFVVYGIAFALFSFVNILQYFDITKTLNFDIKYIPRHAFYLFFLPLISLAPFLKVHSCMEFIKKYRFNIMIVLYVSYIIVGKSGSVNIMLLFALCFLSLSCGRDIKAKDWLVMVTILLLPCTDNGNTAMLILKIIYAGVFVVCNALNLQKIVMIFASCTIPLILFYSFLLPMMPRLYNGIPDVNIRWRAVVWSEQLHLLKQTSGIGVGYGSAYVSDEFVKSQMTIIKEHLCPRCGIGTIPESLVAGPFMGEDIYTTEEKAFVVGSHNSVVTIAFRLGLIGIALFVAALIYMWVKLLKSKSKHFGLAAFLFCGMSFVISFNVGLESPAFLCGFIVYMSVVNGLISSSKEKLDKNSEEIMGE